MVRKILIVDDSDIISNVMRSVLEHSGYDVSEAGDGYEALDALGKKGSDLVITDMIMPGMGGAELINRMADSQELYDIPVIVVTANIDGRKDKTSGNGCVVAWIEKPFRIKHLLAEVREALERTMENCLEGT